MLILMQFLRQGQFYWPMNANIFTALHTEHGNFVEAFLLVGY